MEQDYGEKINLPEIILFHDSINGMASENEEGSDSAAQSLSTAHEEDGVNALSGSSTCTSPSREHVEWHSSASDSENDKSTGHSLKDQDERSLLDIPASVARVLSPAVIRAVSGQRPTTVSTPSQNTDPATPGANTNRDEEKVSD